MDAAKPELEAAEKALSMLDKAAITEVKSFPKPPAAVELVCEAVMILLGEKTDWSSVKVVLGNVNEFIGRLKGYNEQMKKVPESVFNKVRSKYLSKPEFNAKDVESKSKAAGCLCIWVISCCKY